MIGGFTVAVQPVRLPLDPVPSDAKPFEIFLDGVGIFLFRPLGVGIVEAQDELPTRLFGDQVIEQRSPQVTDMQKAGGRGRETGRNGHDVAFFNTRSVFQIGAELSISGA